MERRVNYILVALFSLALVAGFVTFVLWAHQRGGGKTLRHYAIYFDSAINGLSLGSSVRYLGVAVGNVHAIKLDMTNATPRVRVQVGIDAALPISEGTLATMKPSGITGVYFIDLRSDPSKPEPVSAAEGELPVIASEPSDIDRLLGGASGSLERLERILARTETLLSDDNLDRFAALLKEGVAAMRDLQETLIETKQTARSITGLADSLSENPSKILFPPAPEGVRIEP
jgi:phospholipid/cholesterol/gamma-HCH transport system substrate-binding protein